MPRAAPSEGGPGAKRCDRWHQPAQGLWCGCNGVMQGIGSIKISARVIGSEIIGNVDVPDAYA